MTEILEIDFDSKYILVCKKKLSPGEIENIQRAWDSFVASKAPVLFVIHGEEFELIEREEEKR